ncbi:MAG: hypothetical protein ACI8X5_003995, partial [Planctomycetota bacterium]
MLRARKDSGSWHSLFALSSRILPEMTTPRALLLLAAILVACLALTFLWGGGELDGRLSPGARPGVSHGGGEDLAPASALPVAVAPQLKEAEVQTAREVVNKKKASTELRVHVEDDRGLAIEKARLRIEGGTSWGLLGETDGLGNFAWEQSWRGASADSISIAVSCLGYGARILQVASETEELLVVLSSGMSIEGTVVEAPSTLDLEVLCIPARYGYAEYDQSEKRNPSFTRWPVDLEGNFTITGLDENSEYSVSVIGKSGITLAEQFRPRPPGMLWAKLYWRPVLGAMVQFKSADGGRLRFDSSLELGLTDSAMLPEIEIPPGYELLDPAKQGLAARLLSMRGENCDASDISCHKYLLLRRLGRNEEEFAAAVPLSFQLPGYAPFDGEAEIEPVGAALRVQRFALVPILFKWGSVEVEIEAASYLKRRARVLLEDSVYYLCLANAHERSYWKLGWPLPDRVRLEHVLAGNYSLFLTSAGGVRELEGSPRIVKIGEVEAQAKIELSQGGSVSFRVLESVEGIDLSVLNLFVSRQGVAGSNNRFTLKAPLYDLRHLPPGKYSAEVAHHMDWTGKSFSLPEFEIEPSQVTAV